MTVDGLAKGGRGGCEVVPLSQRRRFSVDRKWYTPSAAVGAGSDRNPFHRPCRFLRIVETESGTGYSSLNRTYVGRVPPMGRCTFFLEKSIWKKLPICADGLRSCHASRVFSRREKLKSVTKSGSERKVAVQRPVPLYRFCSVAVTVFRRRRPLQVRGVRVWPEVVHESGTGVADAVYEFLTGATAR